MFKTAYLRGYCKVANLAGGSPNIGSLRQMYQYGQINGNQYSAGPMIQTIRPPYGPRYGTWIPPQPARRRIDYAKGGLYRGGIDHDWGGLLRGVTHPFWGFGQMSPEQRRWAVMM